MANNSINLVDLDHNTLKQNFITYLRTQEQFKDYDFDGSNMSVVLDILAHNTFKNAFFLNMVTSEAFLDSAQLQNSVLSHAKELNYTPRSKRSAKAIVNVTFEANGANQPYLIPKGASFTSIVKNDLYIFSTAENISVSSPNNTFSFNAELYEGSYVNDTYIFNSSVEFPKFRITNKDVDTTSLTVVVYEDNADIGDNYQLATTLLGLNENSKVFFLQASQNGYYEVLFGDNILGRQPKNNSIIQLDYRVSKGAFPNGARSFSVNFDPTNPYDELIGDLEVTTTSIALNGADEESMESVKFYAPRHFQVQERAVTTNDYEILLKTQFPEINVISVYGGEEVEPPRYGKVFVSVDISDVDGLPESKKTEYANFLKSRSPLSIDPIFTEPDYLYYNVNTLVRYNLNVTANSTERIRTLVTNSIVTYNNDNLNDFKSTLRYSKLSQTIDESDTSIISNQTDIFAYKKINPQLGVSQNIDINFGFPIFEVDYVVDSQATAISTTNRARSTRSIYSSPFSFAGTICTLDDDGIGNIRIVRAVGDSNFVITNAGTVDYKKGLIKLINFNINSYEGSSLKIYVKSADRDLSSSRNTILTLEPSEITIRVEAIRI
jgi:hypothetical protein